MSSEAFASSTQRPRSWPLLMGGITFLVTTLYPPLTLSLNHSIIPGWLGTFFVYNVNGGIIWQLIHYIKDNTFVDFPFGAMLWMILPFCTVPIALTLSVVLIWRRMMNRTAPPTAQRGMLAVLLATALSLLAIVLLTLVFFGIVALFSSAGSVALLGMTIFGVAALAQSLWVLPALLIAGAILARMQARMGSSS